jgi:hypothetical protein
MSQPHPPARPITVGSALFALTLVGIGVLGFVKGDFPSIWTPVSKVTPGRELLAYATAAISLWAGVAMLAQRTAPLATRLLFAWLLAMLLIEKIPHMVVAFAVDTWWAVGKLLVMSGAAWVAFARWNAGDANPQVQFLTGPVGLRIAEGLYGLALIPFGLAHFLYLNNTATLVPHWLLWPVGWSYFTGAAFVAAGVAMIAGVMGRLAAALSTAQMGLFTLIIWVPIVTFGKPTPFQWAEFVTSVALTSAGWLVAESYGDWRAPASA